MLKPRGRPISRDGIELRKAIRADVDANPATTHQDLRRKFCVAQAVVDSAMTRTVAEWDASVENSAEPPRQKPTTAKPSEIVKPARPAIAKHPETVKPVKPLVDPAPEAKIPGLEQGFVKFTRKPAKMGEDHIFWIPRVYLKNGLVDPNAEYEVYLRKVPKKEEHQY
nr:hypothetical protein [Candidatus Sigynarchaeota archaeon]